MAIGGDLGREFLKHLPRYDSGPAAPVPAKPCVIRRFFMRERNRGADATGRRLSPTRLFFAAPGLTMVHQSPRLCAGVLMAVKYIVRHGTMRFLGEFEAGEGEIFARAEDVVLRSDRGLEV